MGSINLETAMHATKAAFSKAAEFGINVSLSVVDEAGRLVLTLRGDGAGFFTVETAQAKATAAAAFKKPTRDIVELYKSNPAFWPAVPAISSGKVLPTTGAVPLLQNGVIIGAIGCGGGSPEQDHECVMAAAQALTA